MIAQSLKSAFKALVLLPVCVLATLSASAAPTTFYLQPQPSNQEQYMLELINRARANPAAEGEMLANVTDPDILHAYSQYAVDTNKLKSDFAGYKAQQPLAFNSKLMMTTYSQSTDQATNGFQSHNGSNGLTFADRMGIIGYQDRLCGENADAYAKGVYYAHVNLNADWGVYDLGHRMNIMSSYAKYQPFKEVGISIVPTNIAGFGPLVVTQDFSTPNDPNVGYVVGVVYNDLNGNGAYDEGEGLSGVTVTPDGGSYYTTTSASGGYVLPLPTDVSGSLKVSVSGGSLGAARVKTLDYTVGTNVKLDFTTSDAVDNSVNQVSIKTVNKIAASDGSRVGVVTVTRTGDNSTDLTVALAVGGNAVNGVDYTELSSSVTIPAGQDSTTLTVEPVIQQFTGVKKIKFNVAPSASYTQNTAATIAKVKIVQ